MLILPFYIVRNVNPLDFHVLKELLKALFEFRSILRDVNRQKSVIPKLILGAIHMLFDTQWYRLDNLRFRSKLEGHLVILG